MGYQQHYMQQHRSHSSGGRGMMRSSQQQHQQQQQQYGGGINVPQSTPGQHMRSNSGSFHFSIQQLQQYNNSQAYARRGNSHGMSQQNYLSQQQQQQHQGSYHSTPPMMGHHPYGASFMNYHQQQQQHGLPMMGDFPDFHPLPPSEHFQRRPHPHHQYSYEDDSPRSPSPPHIPPPLAKEHQQPTPVPQSAPPKLRVQKYFGEEAQRSNLGSRRLALEEAAGPLRESRVHNTLDSSASGNHPLMPKMTEQQQQQQQGEDGASAKKPPSKPVAVQHASLLLGLRDKSNANTPESVKPPREQVKAEDNEKQGPTGSERPAEASSSDTATQSSATKNKERPNRLVTPQDRANLNSMHCFIRSELLEVFVVDPEGDPAKNSMAGRVGMQCVHCARNRHRDPRRQNEATMAVFYPRSVQEIYRLVTNWTRCHLNKCKNIPPDVRKHWDALKAMDKTRGKTQYWTVSAQEIGLVNCTATRAGGVRFADDPKNELACVSEE